MSVAAYDIDGTLARSGGPLASRKTIPKVVAQLKRDDAKGDVAYVTNRPKRFEKLTREWLKSRGLPEGKLMMAADMDQVRSKQKNLDRLRPDVMYENDRSIVRGVTGHNVQHIDEITKSAFGVVHKGTVKDADRRMQGQADWYNERNSRVINRAAGDKKYKKVSDNVYARQRKFGSKNSKAFVSAVADRNKKHPSDVYVRTRYPNLVLGGKYEHTDKRKEGKITGYPAVFPTKKRELKAKGLGAHEQQHHRDFSGKHPMTPYKPALDKAKKQLKQGKGHGWNTSQRYQGLVAANMARTRGKYEGKADRAASKYTGLAPKKITGYSQLANMDPNFGRGYGKKVGDGNKAIAKSAFGVLHAG